ncbi:Rpn family recombination-promoting nuclease/putative transposase [Cystobacter fuscus]
MVQSAPGARQRGGPGELRETESDTLFTAHLRTGRPLLLYVLLEHPSVDRWMALRMLRYVGV